MQGVHATIDRDSFVRENRLMTRNSRISTANGLVLAVLFCLSAAASAQDEDDWQNWPLGHRFGIGAGAFFANLDTKVRIDSSNGITGTRLDFEQNLGMSDFEPLPTLQAEWRFARRHQLDLSYFQLRRTGREITETTIRIGDTVFNVDLPVSSIFDVDTLNLSYQYSLVFDPKKELAIGLGVSLQDMRIGFEGDQGGTVIQEESDLLAPLPTINLSGSYAFTDKWTLKAGVGVFAVAMELGDDDDVDGKIFVASAVVYHQTFDNVRFGFGYSLFDLDVSWTYKGKFTAVQYIYHGPHLVIGATF